MKAIIIAGGVGSRLKKYTKDAHKGMLPLGGKSILELEIESLRKGGVNEIILVTGFKAEKINIPGVKYIYDPDWESKDTSISNILFFVQDLFDGSDDILIGYADTIHEPKIIKQIIKENYPLSKAIDIDYKDYWIARNGDYKIDSESCTLNKDGSIKEIGEDGITDDNRLDGRDASLTFISKNFAPKVIKYYIELHQKYKTQPLINGKPVRRFNMTNLLQSWINNGWTVMANKIKRGWMEFDTNEDYENAIQWAKSGKIKEFIDWDSIIEK